MRRLHRGINALLPHGVEGGKRYGRPLKLRPKKPSRDTNLPRARAFCIVKDFPPGFFLLHRDRPKLSLETSLLECKNNSLSLKKKNNDSQAAEKFQCRRFLEQLKNKKWVETEAREYRGASETPQ